MRRTLIKLLLLWTTVAVQTLQGSNRFKLFYPNEGVVNIATDKEKFYSVPQFGKVFSILPDLKVNWVTAHNYCRQEECDLLAFESKQELLYIKDLVEDYAIAFSSRLNSDVDGSSHWWISAHDLFTTPGSYSWLYTGKPLSFEDTVPFLSRTFRNASNTVDTKYGSCLAIISMQGEAERQFRIEPISCNLKLGVICQYMA